MNRVATAFAWRGAAQTIARRQHTCASRRAASSAAAALAPSPASSWRALGVGLGAALAASAVVSAVAPARAAGGSTVADDVKELEARVSRLDSATGGEGLPTRASASTRERLLGIQSAAAAIQGRLKAIEDDVLRERAAMAVESIDVARECRESSCTICQAYCGTECAQAFFRMIKCGEAVPKDRRVDMCLQHVEAVRVCTIKNKDYFEKHMAEAKVKAANDDEES